MLATYEDWTDTPPQEWPRSVKEETKVKREHDKQEDPTEKKGVVGAFCRVYPISRAIDYLLEDVYTPTDMDDRYTFTGGSTSAGLVLYDDLWAYSNHSPILPGAEALQRIRPSAPTQVRRASTRKTNRALRHPPSRRWSSGHPS